MGIRDEARERTTAAILLAARAEIAEHGGGGLSMRRVAREVGLVSSAVYRYFPSREALLTAMIVESYGHLAAALRQVVEVKQAEARRSEPDPSARTSVPDPDVPDSGAVFSDAEAWSELAYAFRRWGISNPHEFQLIYGTPMPGYAAPPETVPAATSVAEPFLTVGARRPVSGFDAAPLRAQMSPLTEREGDKATLDPAGCAAVIAELAALVGFVSLELAGHFVGTADPADHLYAALVERQARTLRLDG